MAQIFNTSIADLNEMRMWEIDELIGLAREQHRERERANRNAARKRKRTGR